MAMTAPERSQRMTASNADVGDMARGATTLVHVHEDR
jgi:hypothetical protein